MKMNDETGVLELTPTEIELRSLVDSYVEDIKSQELTAEAAGEYSVRYTINGDGSYYSVFLLLAGGGPTVYVDTQELKITGVWAEDEYSVNFYPPHLDYLDEYWEEQYNNLKEKIKFYQSA